MEPILKIIDLKKYFQVHGRCQLHAVDGVNMEIMEGRTLGVVGESGCGKSTLGLVVLRLLEATSGQIIFAGKDITTYSRKQTKLLRREMQIIFQDPYSSLNPRMSVFDLIAEPMVMQKIYRHHADLSKRILDLMDMVGLAERYINSYPHEMDGGRRQRVGVARALALNPRFIVCDEPVSALDVSIQAQILNLLMDLQQELKLTYLFITHDLSVVKHISNDIAVMYLGQCVEMAPARELFKNPLHPYTKALLSAIPVPRLHGGAKIKRQIIRGEVSDPIDPPPGCRFASRCVFYTERCSVRDLPLANQGDGHLVACCLYE